MDYFSYLYYMKEVEYKSNYLVYPDGRIWLKRANRFAKFYKTSKGYLTVKINGKNPKVHRIVAKCFIANPENKPEVNHWDGIKTNNHILNLLWSTHAENIEHSINVLGNTQNRTPVIATHILTGKTYEFPSQMACLRTLGLNSAHMSACLKGRRKTHKGYTFQYLT